VNRYFIRYLIHRTVAVDSSCQKFLLLFLLDELHLLVGACCIFALRPIKIAIVAIPKLTLPTPDGFIHSSKIFYEWDVSGRNVHVNLGDSCQKCFHK
jgi:hypothetical protein